MSRASRQSPSRSWAVVRHEVRIFRRDPVFFAIFTTMPLIVMAFIIPAFRYLPSGLHSGGLSGAQQAVPGMAVMFSLFLVGNVGFSFFREYGWKTWDRVRASCATPAEVMVGKVAVPLLQSAIQLAVLFALGGVLFDLHVKGSKVALAVLAASFSVSLVCLGLALLAICKTILQLNAIANLGAIVLAGIGGAIVPTTTLPGWAKSAAPFTPGYWAMRGFRNVILDGAGFAGVATSIGILMAFSAAFVVIAAWRFHFNDNKTSFA
jgi:ABC-2 type transport system permease protein